MACTQNYIDCSLANDQIRRVYKADTEVVLLPERGLAASTLVPQDDGKPGVVAGELALPRARDAA